MRAGPPQRTPGSAKDRCQNPGNNAIFLDLGGSFGKAQTRGNLQLLIFHLGRPTKKKIKKSTFWWRRSVLLCWPNKMENCHIWGLCYIFIECSSGHPCQYPDEHSLFCGIGSGHVLGHVGVSKGLGGAKFWRNRTSRIKLAPMLDLYWVFTCRYPDEHAYVGSMLSYVRLKREVGPKTVRCLLGTLI